MTEEEAKKVYNDVSSSYAKILYHYGQVAEHYGGYQWWNDCAKQANADKEEADRLKGLQNNKDRKDLYESCLMFNDNPTEPRNKLANLCWTEMMVDPKAS